jgi:polysaccharide biosynthesis protein PslG
MPKMTPQGTRRRATGALVLVLAFVLALATLAAPATAASAATTARVPQGFVGMNIGDPLFPDTDPSVNLPAQLNVMVASGVETIRIPVYWSLMQPYADWAAVPAAQRAQFTSVGGIPTRFGPLDEIVALAAQRGLGVLPVVIDAPAWDAASPAGQLTVPRSDGPYGAFVAALARRYGPRGRFWATHGPARPIRTWEIWNEPNIAGYWPLQPFERGYVDLLRAAHTAIKRVDPGATVVLAGMPNDSWGYLAKIYAIHGARELFDAVAVHPYTRTPQGVITIVSYVREVMRANGDGGKPILLSEIGWPSSVGQTATLGFETTEAGQAHNIAVLLPLLAANRTRLGIAGLDLYTWAGVEAPGAYTFDFAGLFRFTAGTFVAKPAYQAFRRGALALEHCATKAATATRCRAVA